MDNCESDDDEDDSTISETEDDTAEQVHICVNMANGLQFTERKQNKLLNLACSGLYGHDKEYFILF